MTGRKRFSAALTVILALLCLIIGAGAGFYGYFRLTLPDDSDVYVSGDLSIHFIELGNKYTGDCTYIKAGNNDILIDAGSKTSSVQTIRSYLDEYVTDGTLEYVIVTHAHEDHYAGFATNESTDSLFDIYDCKMIIDFSRVTEGKESQTMYKNYERELADEVANGAEHLTAEECIKNGKSIFDLGNGMELQILDSYYYYNVSDTENNHSVCCMIEQGDKNFLFTGDLEKDGEEKLTQMNELPQVTLYKAGHHGSKTSSNEVLLSVIKPEIVCVCCCCGSTEYTSANESTFPTQAFIDRIAPYTDRVYITTLCVDYNNGEYKSMNGNIVLTSGKNGVEVSCSENNTLLPDTDWFAKKRTCPSAWKNRK